MRRIKKPIYALIFIYIMLGAPLYFLQEKLIFLPTVLSQDYEYSFKTPFEELFLKADDGAVINALHFTAENPKGVILYFHGNAGDLSRWGEVTSLFVDKDYDVLVMDYRTYGKSTGKLSEQALYKDAQLCYDYLIKRYKNDAITVYGRSLGTGIAANLVSKNSVNQLILETPYYSLTEVAKKRFPIFPIESLLKYKMPSHEFLKEVTRPITMFHGTRDVVVPYESGKKLFDTLKNPQKKFITINGGEHNNLVEFETYLREIDEVLK